MNEKNYKILILFGGVSSEHDISCISAASVMKNIDIEKYDVTAIGITKDGKWMLTEALPEEVESGEWSGIRTNKDAFVSPDRRDKGIIIKEIDGTYTCRHIDIVFPVLHGKNGEDGTMQGFLELAGIPYVGCDMFASACAMDKSVTKLLAGRTGVTQADYYLLTRFGFADDPLGEIARIEEHFDKRYPFFVKPCSAGSSVGVTKAADVDGLFESIKTALSEDSKALVEETITGREIEVAVIGNRNVRTSLVGEVLAADEFYSFEAKYENEESKTRILTDVSKEKTEEIRDYTAAIYKAVGCRGMARVDFFLTEDETVVFNELNTIPGFTGISMYPKLWEAEGISAAELIDDLLMLAVDEME